MNDDFTFLSNRLRSSGNGSLVQDVGSPSEIPNDPPAVDFQSAPQGLLKPLLALQNPGLISSVYPVSIGTVRHEIHKFLVLGKRAGGTPIRLSLFGGVDPGCTDTISAVVKVLTLLTLGPALAQDYAVFGYPWVAHSGFEEKRDLDETNTVLASRWKADPEAPDALFFRAEFQRISPNGIITLRSSKTADSLRANVNSRVIAEDVVKPALLRLKSLMPVHENPVAIFSMDAAARREQFMDGRLIPSPDTQPWPFEVELVVPVEFSPELKVQTLVLATLDVLRSYRAFVCLGGEL